MDHSFFRCLLLPLPVPGKLAAQEKNVGGGQRPGRAHGGDVSKAAGRATLPHQWLVPACVVLALSEAFAPGDQF